MSRRLVLPEANLSRAHDERPLLVDSQHSCRLTLPLSCGPQVKTPGIPHKACAVGRQLQWNVRPRCCERAAYSALRFCDSLLQVLRHHTSSSVRLADHLVRLKEDRWKDGEPKSLNGLQVDHELELRRLLHGQVGGLGTTQDL